MITILKNGNFVKNNKFNLCPCEKFEVMSYQKENFSNTTTTGDKTK